MSRFFMAIASLLLSSLAFAGLDERIQIAIEEPAAGGRYSGISNLRGWAVSPAGMGSNYLDVYIDGEFVFDLVVYGKRTDVGNAFPDYPGSDTGGFSMAYNYKDLSPGEHEIRIRAFDNAGNYNDATATFTTERLGSQFIAEDSAVDLSTASITRSDDQTITISNATVEGEQYDFMLTWDRASQGFKAQDIQGGPCPGFRPLPSGYSHCDTTGTPTGDGNIGSTVDRNNGTGGKYDGYFYRPFNAWYGHLTLCELEGDTNIPGYGYGGSGDYFSLLGAGKGVVIKEKYSWSSLPGEYLLFQSSDGIWHLMGRAFQLDSYTRNTNFVRLLTGVEFEENTPDSILDLNENPSVCSALTIGIDSSQQCAVNGPACECKDQACNLVDPGSLRIVGEGADDEGNWRIYRWDDYQVEETYSTEAKFYNCTIPAGASVYEREVYRQAGSGYNLEGREMIDLETAEYCATDPDWRVQR